MSSDLNERMTTYRMADGDLIYGEFKFVTGDPDDWFQDLDEPIEVVKDTWVKVASETLTYKPPYWQDVEDDD